MFIPYAKLTLNVQKLIATYGSLNVMSTCGDLEVTHIASSKIFLFIFYYIYFVYFLFNIGIKPAKLITTYGSLNATSACENLKVSHSKF